MERNPLDLYTLEDACKLFFSNIPITPKDLRKEARRGRLTITRINRQPCVTEQALREMLAACQENNSRLDYGQDRLGKTEARFGLSSTPEGKSALAALDHKLEKLRSASPNTSRKSTRRQANVVPLRP